MNKIAIIGLGYVGSAYQKLFPEAVIYDPAKGFDNKETVNSCDLAIVCVPTPQSPDNSCDTSIIEEAISWLKTPLILIKSTIPPGTTKALKEKYQKRICHSPEYLGEGKYFIAPWKYPHPTEVQYHEFMIIGGAPEDRDEIIQIFLPILGPDKFYYQVDETTSELIKYMENSFLATKITFCQEFFEIANKLNVDFNQLREGWLLDSRIGRSHTSVFKNKRGFSGKCLPKDLNAIVKTAEKSGYEPKFLKQVLKSNDDFLAKNPPQTK